MHTFILFTLGCSDSQRVETTEQDIIADQENNMVSLRIDFGENSETEWFIVNDDVMGGVSTSDALVTESSLIFSGEVSTDNNGGFVSLRSPTGEYDLSQYSMVEIAYKADGHDFSMILADDLMWYLPEFRHEVIPTSDEWTTTSTSLYDFKQYAMTGYGDSETGVEMSAQYLSDVIRLELRNSVFASGDFRLEIDYIEFQGFIEE